MEHYFPFIIHEECCNLTFLAKVLKRNCGLLHLKEGGW